MTVSFLLFAVAFTGPAPGQSDLITRAQQDKMLVFAGTLDDEHGGSGILVVIRPSGNRLLLQIDRAPEAKGNPSYYSNPEKVDEALKRINDDDATRQERHIPQVSKSEDALLFRRGKRDGPSVRYLVKSVEGMGKLSLRLTRGEICTDCCLVQNATLELVRP